MFLDVRGFSALFEQHDPLDIWEFANTVLSEMAEEVERSRGAIDKFTGDGFLAHFGILHPSQTHVRDACDCVLRIRKRVAKLNQTRKNSAQPIIKVGMGIHTGMVASGVIATPGKAEFTVFGNVVNFASRVEGLTKDFIVDCLVSSAVHAAIGDKLAFKQMAERKVRGFEAPQTTYWLLPTNSI